MAGASVTVLLVGVFMAWWIGRSRSEGDANTDQTRASVGSQPADAAPDTQPAVADGAQARWQDGVAEEILDVSSKVDQLEQQSQRLWGSPETHRQKEGSP